MPRNIVAVTALLLLTLTHAAPALSAAEAEQQQEEQTYRYLETFANVLSILQDNYVEKIETKEAIEGAINGLLLSLDPHSSYLSPEVYREFRNETSGSFTGIGIQITIKDGVITVISPIADTPADKAGIVANDQILEIDGEPTKGKTVFDVVKVLRGPKGTEVTLSILRTEWEKARDFTLVRSDIPLQSVKSLTLKPGFGYLQITNFQRNTATELRQHLRDLEREAPLQGLVLDLRNNPGGLLDQAVDVSDLFLDQGLIVYTKGRKQSQDLTYEAREGDTVGRYPLVLLVNEGTASASEIVAGAIQDHKRGIIVGTPTFGKGSVQSIVPLNDGAGLKMTTAHYYTPSGRSIQATGITPDVTVAQAQQGPGQSAPRRITRPREIDLDNHFSPEPPADGVPTEPELLSAEVQQRLDEDNQLQAAFDILRSLAVYASFQNGGALVQ